jgi:large conductance mechanosensitive channel
MRATSSIKSTSRDRSRRQLGVENSASRGPPLAAARDAGTPVVAYGLFINNVVEFLVIALSIFLVVRQINRMRGVKPAA